MKTSPFLIPLAAFAVGLAVGASVLALIRPASPAADAADAADAAAAGESPHGARLETMLAQARSEIDRLRAELERRDAALASGGDAGAAGAAASPAPGGDTAGDDDDAARPRTAATFIDMMAEMGREEENRKLEATLAGFVERFALTESQAAAFRDALVARNEARLEAAKRIMSGTATVADLAAADEDNFAAFDRAVEGLLDPTQAAAFEEYRNEREFERVQRKTTEDLDGLKRIADLTPEQEEAAWAVFAGAHAEQPPGAVPPDFGIAELEGFVDGEIGKRVEGLRPILAPDQLEAYEAQAETFKSTVLKMAGFATGSGDSGPAEP